VRALFVMCVFVLVLDRALVVCGGGGGSLWVAVVVMVVGSRLCIVVDLFEWLFLFACVDMLVDAF
jgi:hypothetical protein